MKPKFSVPISGKRKRIYYTLNNQKLTDGAIKSMSYVFPGIDFVPPILNIFRLLYIKYYLSKKGVYEDKEYDNIINKNISNEEKLIQIIYACSGLLTRKTISWTFVYPLSEVGAEDMKLVFYLWTLLTYREDDPDSNYLIRESLKRDLYKLYKVYKKTQYEEEDDMKNAFIIAETLFYKFKEPMDISFEKLKTELAKKFAQKYNKNILSYNWSSQGGGIPDLIRKDIYTMMLHILRDKLLERTDANLNVNKLILMVNGRKGFNTLSAQAKRHINTDYQYFQIDPYSGIMTPQNTPTVDRWYGAQDVAYPQQHAAAAQPGRAVPGPSRAAQSPPPSSVASSSAASSRRSTISSASSSSSSSDDQRHSFILRCKRKKRRK